MNTEIKICKGDLCGSVMTKTDIATAFIAGLALGALAYAFYIHRKNGGLRSVIFFSGSRFNI